MRISGSSASKNIYPRKSWALAWVYPGRPFPNENGTEADFKRAVEVLGEVILSGRATTEDYLNYGLLYQVRAYRDTNMALGYYHKAITEGNGNRDSLG